MTSLGRFWVSVGVGSIFAAVGAFIVAVFGPLLFPLSLSGSEHPEESTFILFVLVLLFFGASGFMLGWRLTRNSVEKAEGPTSLKLDSHDH